MADSSRIDDLRRRVQKDPASIAFAQLAEECRRVGEFQESIDICRAGLGIHPGYLSARVTLGRALVELGRLDEAQIELSRVLESAPENLAAIRGLAEIYHRRGDLGEALKQYRAALLLARNDPDLEQTIADLSRQIEPAKPAPSGGLTMQHMRDELLKHATPLSKPDRGVRVQADNPAEAGFHDAVPLDNPVEAGFYDAVPLGNPAEAESDDAVPSQNLAEAGFHDADVRVAPPPISTGFAASGTLTAAPDDRATRTVAALEQWLAAIHVSREQRNP